MATRQDRKLYNFKSVGDLSTDLFSQVIKRDPKPIGIVTPISMGNGNNLFKMHTKLENQLSDNLRNLVLTNHGERLGRYDFGANLAELTFELGTEAADHIAMMRIKKAVTKYLPYVQLDGFATEVDHFDNKEVAKVVLFMTYSIPKVFAKDKAIRITLYNAG